MSDKQREQMDAMTLDKERAGYLLDSVIITSLKVDIHEPFYRFLQVLEEDHNPVVNVVADDLRSHLKQPQLSTQRFSCPDGHLSSPYPEYPPQSLDGQPSSLQPNLVHQLPIPEHPRPEQPYPYPEQSYPEQPPLGQQFYTGSYSEQPYPVQPNCVYPYSGQPNPGQPPQGQQFYNRSNCIQPNLVQPYPGQPYHYPGQSNPGQQVYSGPNPGLPYPVQPNPGEPQPSGYPQGNFNDCIN